MSIRDSKRGFVARPTDPEARARRPDSTAIGHAKGEFAPPASPSTSPRNSAAASRSPRSSADRPSPTCCASCSRASSPTKTETRNERQRSSRRPSNDAATALTHVELTWLEKRIEHWIRFGRIAEEKVLDRRRRIVSFAPGGVFVFVRWASNDFGTIISPSTSYAQLRRENPTRRCHSSVRAATFCCGSTAGRRSIRFCRRSTWWKPPASIPPTPRRTIGGTSTIA